MGQVITINGYGTSVTFLIVITTYSCQISLSAAFLLNTLEPRNNRRNQYITPTLLSYYHFPNNIFHHPPQRVAKESTLAPRF